MYYTHQTSPTCFALHYYVKRFTFHTSASRPITTHISQVYKQHFQKVVSTHSGVCNVSMRIFTDALYWTIYTKTYSDMSRLCGDAQNACTHHIHEFANKCFKIPCKILEETQGYDRSGKCTQWCMQRFHEDLHRCAVMDDLHENVL